MRATKRKKEEEEEEKEKKKPKKDKKKKKKKDKKDEDVDKKEEEEIEKKEEEKEILETIKEVEKDDIKPVVVEEQLQIKVKTAGGTFEMKTIGIKKRKPQKYRCRICIILLNTVMECNHHIAEVHNLKGFKCDECEENSLNRHKKAHNEGTEMIKCGYCPKKFLHNSQKK